MGKMVEREPSPLSRRLFLGQAAAACAGLYAARSAALALDSRSGAGAGSTVAIIGGGVAGLTAAHELAERGVRVTLIERKALGGKARSIPVPGTGAGGRRDLPAEHGFRAEFGFYQNLPDMMRRTPYPGNANGVHDNMVPVSVARLSRRGEPDATVPLEWEGWRPQPSSFRDMWESVQAAMASGRRMPPHEVAFFARQVAIFFTSCEARRLGQWEHVNWWDYTRADQMSAEYRKQFADGLTRNLAAAKPRDMSVNSTGIVGESFAYSLGGRPDHPDGAADRVLNGPTNEAWIDPWVAELRRLGVEIWLGAAAERLDVRGGRVSRVGVRLGDGAMTEISPDFVVCAVPVERALALFTGDVLAADPSLVSLGRLRTEWMNGVVFHLDRPVPVTHGHVNYLDSEFALTSISQAQVWRRDFAATYGDGRAQESFSAIISDWSAPGMVYGKPAWSLTPDQICDEVWAQLKAHLNDSGRVLLRDEWIISRFVDPAISYPDGRRHSERIAENDEPLLINTPGSWGDRPGTGTAIRNLMLAGDYVRNTMNVATMESACETGKRAAQAVLDAAGLPGPPVRIHDRWTPPENEPLKRLDEERWKANLPHALDTPWITPG